MALAAPFAAPPAALPARSTAPAAPFADHPTLEAIRANAAALRGRVLETPVWRWQTGIVAERLAPATEVWLKLELWQRTGSFKLRGALTAIDALSAEARSRGVVAASAGNHAVAVATAAQAAGTPAIVCMPRHASAARQSACRAAGAELRLFDTIHAAFAAAQALAGEGRAMIHPFDGPLTALGTSGVGLELMQQVPGLDAVIVPIGGGGLAGGIAAAVKQIDPRCQVIGVEPCGADAMSRSFEADTPVQLEQVDTVADSLGAPYALPYSYGLCRRFVDRVVRLDDDALCQALHWLQRDMKLALEPAAAAATAALLGPLRGALDGRKVGLIVCGSNLDAARYAALLARGAARGDGLPVPASAASDER